MWKTVAQNIPIRQDVYLTLDGRNPIIKQRKSLEDKCENMDIYQQIKINLHFLRKLYNGTCLRLPTICFLPAIEKALDDCNRNCRPEEQELRTDARRFRIPKNFLKTLHVKKIKRVKRDMYASYQSLYVTVFPKNEQNPICSLKQSMKKTRKKIEQQTSQNNSCVKYER